MSQSDYRQQNHYYPPFQTERSWSILANETFVEDENDNLPPRFLSEKSWSVLPSNDAEERRFLNNVSSNTTNPPAASDLFSRAQSFPNPLSRETTAGMPEPEFQPSLASSTKEFLEDTFKFERKRAEDFVGRPDEHDQDYDPTPCASNVFQSPPQQQQQQQQPPQQPNTAVFGWSAAIAVPVIGLAIVVYFLLFN